MGLPIQLQDQLDKYLLGELQGEALEIFLQELKNNPELEATARIQAAMIPQLALMKKEQYFREIHELVEHKSEGLLTKPIRKYPLPLILSIAASIFLIGFFLLFKQSDEQQLFNEAFKPAPIDIHLAIVALVKTDSASHRINPESVRGNNKGASVKTFLIDSLNYPPKLFQELTELEQSYKSGNYLSAANGFLGLFQTYDSLSFSPAFQYWIMYDAAIAFVKAKKDKEALIQFQRLNTLKAPVDMLGYKVEFYLGLMYLKTEGTSSTSFQEILSKISHDKSHPFALKAAKILKKL